MTEVGMTRICVRHYRDTGQRTFIVCWSAGSTTYYEAKWHDHHRGPNTPSFGRNAHAFLRSAKRRGLRLQRETW